jgi:uncharacterized RDD family membrane protein YckC
MSEGTPPPPPPENPYGAGAGATPPPPPPPSDGPGGYGAPVPPPTGARPGELLDRFLARLIDGVLLFIVGAIINGVVLAAIVSGGGNGIGYGSTTFGAYAVISSIVLALINLGYFAFMESSQGHTVGKMLMKLSVQGPSGGKPTLEEAAKRNIWVAYPILGVVPFLGLVAGLLALVAVIMIAVQINSDPERRPWTDRFAGTRVVKHG